MLFVHGIHGSPCQFRFLTDSLPEDVAYHNLLLPGHGGDFRSFRRSGIEDWQKAVHDTANDLKKRYKKVYYVGHSMGCLLGQHAYFADKIAFDGMLLIACPLKLRFTVQYFTRNHLTVLIKNSKNPYMQAAVEANSISAKYPWQYLSCMHPYLELLRLIKRTRLEITESNCRIIAVHMEKDEIVGEKSLNMLPDTAEKRIYPVCGHNYFTQSAKADMISRLKNLMNMHAQA